jgi:hypothetical protein
MALALTGPAERRSDPAFSGTTIMLIELAVLFAVVAVMGAAFVKVYEWRQDVLHGPYLKRDDRFEIH